MDLILKNLIKAEEKASELFDQIQTRGLICSNKTENDLNKEVFDLAFEMYGIKKYWHKSMIHLCMHMCIIVNIFYQIYRIELLNI